MSGDGQAVEAAQVSTIYIVVVYVTAYGYIGAAHPQNPEFRRAFTQSAFCERYIRKYPTAIKRDIPFTVARVECQRIPIEK